MRDDRTRWPAAQHADQRARAFNGLNLEVWEPSRAFLITGPKPFLQLFSPLTWPEPAQPKAGRVALSLRRDRVLVLGDPGMATGVTADGRSLVSDMSGGFIFTRLEGAEALTVLQSGCALDPREPSASVLRLWHGFEAMIFREGEQAFAIGVEAPWFDGLWSRLVTEAELRLL